MARMLSEGPDGSKRGRTGRSECSRRAALALPTLNAENQRHSRKRERREQRKRAFEHVCIIKQEREGKNDGEVVAQGPTEEVFAQDKLVADVPKCLHESALPKCGRAGGLTLSIFIGAEFWRVRDEQSPQAEK